MTNLHGLVSDKDEPDSQLKETGRVYTFYYNPCKNFLDLGCPNTSVCQKNVYDFYDLGNIHTTEFEYQSNSVVAVYKSQAQNIDDINGTSEVGLVCDEIEVLGRLEFIGEPIRAHYRLSSTLSVDVLDSAKLKMRWSGSVYL